MAITQLPPELIKATGTLTVEDANIEAATGNASLLDHRTDKASGNIATILYEGHDSGAADTSYASVTVDIINNTDASEDGSWSVNTMQAGTLTNCATFALGMAMNGATGGDQGAGTINATGFFVNGVALGGGSGDVVGPASATDNAIVRFDSTTGKLIQNSGVTIDDSDNMTVPGDLTVNGTLTTIDTTNLAVEDSLIQLATNNNAADTLDIGLVGLYDTSGSQDLYAGMFRDATDNKWKLFVDSQEDLSASNTVNTGATGYTVATLVANLEGNVTGQVSDISNFTTDDLTEGATNLYASTANVDAAGAVMEADYNAQTVLVAVTDDTPVATAIAENEFVGRPSGGNIGAMTAAQARTSLNVEDGAQVNFTPNKAIRVEGVDFTGGVTTALTLPAAAPSDNEAYVTVTYDGINQDSGTWSISGTTLTLSEAIPAYITNVELTVWA